MQNVVCVQRVTPELCRYYFSSPICLVCHNATGSEGVVIPQKTEFLRVIVTAGNVPQRSLARETPSDV
jgi:hypothetical protein